MIIQRVAFAILVLLAIVFGINLFSATARFIEVNQIYDTIDISLADFEYSGPRDDVIITLSVTNPADEAIEIISADLRFSANSHFVGGGGTRPNLTVPAGATEEIVIDANIDDVEYMLQLDQEDEIRWLVLARMRISLDDDLEPIWIEFAFRTVTG